MVETESLGAGDHCGDLVGGLDLDADVIQCPWLTGVGEQHQFQRGIGDREVA